MVFAVRPESIRLRAPSAGLQGVIEFTEQLGDSTIVYVRLPWHADLVTVKLSQQQSSYRMGETVGLQLDPEQVLVFDAHKQRLSCV